MNKKRYFPRSVRTSIPALKRQRLLNLCEDQARQSYIVRFLKNQTNIFIIMLFLEKKTSVASLLKIISKINKL